MKTSLRLDILPQPDNTTCGPTCLQAVYRYHRRNVDLERVIAEVPSWEGGGTIAVNLGIHALNQGFDAKIYTYNVHVFDPTWFPTNPANTVQRLTAQAQHKNIRKLQWASAAYVKFLKKGGELHFDDLTTNLIRRYLKRGIPILTGLSATFLYRCARETEDSEPDDIRGEPAGHFVVLCGYDKRSRNVLIADPLLPNPVSKTQYYEVNIDRLICSILLGIVTYDANLLILEPNEKKVRKTERKVSGRKKKKKSQKGGKRSKSTRKERAKKRKSKNK